MGNEERYLIRWETEVLANSPQEAVEKGLKMLDNAEVSSTAQSLELFHVLRYNLVEKS